VVVMMMVVMVSVAVVVTVVVMVVMVVVMMVVAMVSSRFVSSLRRAEAVIQVRLGMGCSKEAVLVVVHSLLQRAMCPPRNLRPRNDVCDRFTLVSRMLVILWRNRGRI